MKISTCKQNTLWLFHYVVYIIVFACALQFSKRWWNSFVIFNLHAKFGTRKPDMLTDWSPYEGFMLTDVFVLHVIAYKAPADCPFIQRECHHIWTSGVIFRRIPVPANTEHAHQYLE